MKTSSGKIILEDAVRFSPTYIGVDYTDESEIRIHIPMKLLVRLYEGSKYQLEKNGYNWEEFCNTLFEEQK